MYIAMKLCDNWDISCIHEIHVHVSLIFSYNFLLLGYRGSLCILSIKTLLDIFIVNISCSLYCVLFFILLNATFWTVEYFNCDEKFILHNNFTIGEFVVRSFEHQRSIGTTFLYRDHEKNLQMCSEAQGAKGWDPGDQIIRQLVPYRHWLCGWPHPHPPIPSSLFLQLRGKQQYVFMRLLGEVNEARNVEPLC